MDRSVLENKSLVELKEIASALELSGYTRMKKADLVDLIIGTASQQSASASQQSASDGEQVESNGAQPGSARTGDDDRDDGGSKTREQRDGAERERGDQSGGDRRTGGRGDDGGRGDGGRNKQRRRGKGGNGRGDDLADAEVREGVLDLLPEGYGFLRTTGYLSGARDVYVSQSYVRRFHLRRGDLVSGPIRSNNRGNDKFPALARVETVEGLDVDEHMALRRPDFRDLTPLFPNDRFDLETGDDSPLSMRIVDLLAPIGKGQRGLVVSPPKAGKTTILRQLAQAIESNDPDSELLVLLVDERPEEVTEFERSTSGEVISSTFDRPADDHTQVAELALERAKRLVERGRDVVVLLDSITRLARAYNLAAPASGRVLSGGLDSAALYPPKRFFGAARNLEEGGSLTIIATALVETGSKLDEVIFEEFKGTGNMELRLDRRLEQRRIFPAIDVLQSGTRREELLHGEGDLESVWKLRRVLGQMDPGAALELLIDKLRSTPSNQQFLKTVARSKLD